MTDEELNAVREQLLADPNLQLSIIGTLVDALTAARRERDEAQRYAATQLEVAAAEVALRIERERERDEARAAHKRILNEAVEYSHDRAVEVERLTRERDEALAIVDMLHDMLDTAFVPRLGTDIGGDLPEDKKPWTLSERLAFLVGYVSTARKRGEPRDGRASSALERAERRGRAAERADVVAYLRQSAADLRSLGAFDSDQTVEDECDDIEAGRHVGAAGKGEAC